jgi:predicted transposase YbfD/YdcC
LILQPVEPMAVDFPFARTVVGIRSVRTLKSSGLTTTEWRFYLSSQDPAEHTPEDWIGLIRGHWAGVENRNHWRRDALWGEDKTRSRDSNLVANLALVRSALFRLLSHHYPLRSHSELRETFAAKPTVAPFTSKS